MCGQMRGKLDSAGKREFLGQSPREAKRGERLITVETWH